MGSPGRCCLAEILHSPDRAELVQLVLSAVHSPYDHDPDFWIFSSFVPLLKSSPQTGKKVSSRKFETLQEEGGLTMAEPNTLRRRQSRQDENANNAATAPRTHFDGGPPTVVFNDAKHLLHEPECTNLMHPLPHQTSEKQHVSLADHGLIIVTTSVLFIVCGVSGLCYIGFVLCDLFFIAPEIVLAHLAAALLTICLGAAGLRLVFIRPTPLSTRLPLISSRDDLQTLPSVPRLSREALLAATHDYGAPLPAGVRVVAEHHEVHYGKHITGQVGPVCAAASVSSALNVLHNLSGDEAFRVRDAMRVYRLMFSDKRSEALAKLQRVVKGVTDVSPVVGLFYEQNICMAARGRNRALFLELLRHNVAAAAEQPASETTLLSALSTALEAPDQPAAALLIDRLKAVAKAEWAMAKLEGRWALPHSGAVLPSTAPVGNDSLSTAVRALAHFSASEGKGKPVRCVSFMGLDARCRHPVSKNDAPEARDAQWEALKAAIARPDIVVIFHLHNHYALISAWRELHADCLGTCHSPPPRSVQHPASPPHGLATHATSSETHLSRATPLSPAHGAGLLPATTALAVNGQGEGQGEEEPRQEAERDGRNRRQILVSPPTPSHHARIHVHVRIHDAYILTCMHAHT